MHGIKIVGPDVFSTLIKLWPMSWRTTPFYSSWAHVSGYSTKTSVSTITPTTHSLNESILHFPLHLCKHTKLDWVCQQDRVFCILNYKNTFFGPAIPNQVLCLKNKSWVFVCKTMFVLNRIFNRLVRRPEMSPGDVLQSTSGEATTTRGGSWFHWHTWTSLHSRTCCFKLKKSLVMVVQWVVLQSLPAKSASFNSFLTSVEVYIDIF